MIKHKSCQMKGNNTLEFLPHKIQHIDYLMGFCKNLISTTYSPLLLTHYNYSKKNDIISIPFQLYHFGFIIHLDKYHSMFLYIEKTLRHILSISFKKHLCKLNKMDDISCILSLFNLKSSLLCYFGKMRCFKEWVPHLELKIEYLYQFIKNLREENLSINFHKDNIEIYMLNNE